MGKFMRKAELKPDAPTLGVRTRARTLALSATEDPEHSYLQLRSRRLQKPPPLSETKKKRNCFSGEEIDNKKFGDNNLGLKPIESTVRESTHSNLISDVSNISTPCLSTKYPSSTAEQTSIPSMSEVDDLFGHFEQQQQQFFVEKYNFDIINDIPLPGRYEWVKLNP